MALLAKQQITEAGLNPVYSAAGGTGDEFEPDDKTYLEVVNGSGGSIDVTVVTPKTHHGHAVADNVTAVPAGQRRKIGPLSKEDYANPADGKADVTYSATGSVTVGCFTL